MLILLSYVLIFLGAVRLARFIAFKYSWCRHVFDLFITVYFWIWMGLSMLSTALLLFLLSPLLSEKNFSFLYEQVSTSITYYAMIIPGIWNCTLIDKREDMGEDQCVFVANHASFADTLFISFVQNKKKYMVARIYIQIPVFGWLCRRAGHVFVDKNDPESCKQAVPSVIKTIQDGASFMLYPEGQRQEQINTLLPFKTGGFRVAYKCGLPIVPITLKGTYEAVRFWGLCSFADIEVIIDPPVTDFVHLTDMINLDKDKISQCVAKVRHIINHNLNPLTSKKLA